MGKLRSRNGCRTCRSRHVKCDEAQPVCGNCTKAGRLCQRDNPREVMIRNYQPQSPRHLDTRDQAISPLVTFDPPLTPRIYNRPVDSHERDSRSHQSPQNVYTTSPLPGSSISIAQLLRPESSTSPPFYDPGGSKWSLTAAVAADSASASARPSIPRTLARHEARLVYYYTRHLGKWLDCTDVSRQFTLKIPALAVSSPILREAIVSFAARHAGDTEAANAAHERCIALLIVQLDTNHVADDDLLLCAIVILRVFEQLNAALAGSDQEAHLAGSSALLRASQGSCADPSAPGLREAAFWIYMRQCLYNACINQQPPNVDFSLTLLPIPETNRDDFLGYLRAETAWANTMTWICATVVQFSFTATNTISAVQDPSSRLQKWEELQAAVDEWARSRPSTFDPIWESDENWSTCDKIPFPEYYFTADWHVVAFGLYHLSCMLLQVYKPKPRFAMRNASSGTLREIETDVLQHARAICGSCRSAPQTVPARITLTQTVFIWGALMTNPIEQGGLIQLLIELERDHAWPTTWIISSLKEEWGKA